MSKLKALLISTAAILSFTVAAGTFSDVFEMPYAETVEYITDRGIIQGYSDGRFCPANTIPRGRCLR